MSKGSARPGRHPQWLRRQVGKQLHQAGATKAQREEVARALGVSERTIRNWIKESQLPPRKEGRPPHSDQLKYQVLVGVTRLVKKKGMTVGRETIHRATGYPLRLIQWALQKVKARKRLKKRKILAKVAQIISVLYKMVIWVIDGAQVGWLEGKKVITELLKDRGSLSIIGTSTGPPASAKEVIALLKKTRKATGSFPLVLMSDNGPAYRSRKVRKFLRRHKIIHLLSRAYCATDNGAAERAVRELREMTGLKSGTQLVDDLETAVLVQLGACAINEEWARASKGGKTASVLHDEMPAWYGVVERAKFFKKTWEAIKKAVRRLEGRPARQKLREAVFEKLRQFGLITITVGGQPVEG